MWHCMLNLEEDPDPGNWENVVTLKQADFRWGELTAPCTWQTVVMIPKGGGTDFRDIGLAGILRKAISGIINCRLSPSIQFHDVLHVLSRGERNRDLHP